MPEEEEQSADTIYEGREEKIVSPKDGKSKVRLGRFLKPCVKSVNQAIGIPYTPLLSEIFSHNLQQWPSKVLFKGWKIPQRNWKEWVEQLAGKYAVIWKQTGICDAIISSIYEVRCNHNLVIGLSEFWCSETNTFVFPWGEATITLEDVMILGGFPVLGEPVTSPLTGELMKIEEKMNKKRIEMSRGKSKKATHSCWMKHYMEKDNEFEHVAFLTLSLLRFVFPSFNKETIGKHVFPIAIHLSRDVPMALAPAVLASLYQDLRLLREQAMASSKSIISVLGPFQLVQLWVYERFLLLVPKLPHSFKPGEPRVARWHKLNSKISLPQVRSVLRLAENFEWRPYAANLKNWHHLSYYKETVQFLFNCSSLDEELQSFVRCLRASELVGMNCKEKYMPNRVAMQFGLDQDLPGDLSGLNFVCENVLFFVPPRSFEAGVSARYFDWWKECKSGREDAIKDVLVQERSLKNLEASPLIQSKKDKDECASVALRSVKDCKKSKSNARIKLKYLCESSDEDIPLLPPVQAKKINRYGCHTAVASGSLENSQKTSQVSTKSYGDQEKHASVTREFSSEIKIKHIYKDSSDLPISVPWVRCANFADRTSPRKAYPCKQSQNVVPPENIRKRKLPTATEESKGKIRLVDRIVAEEVKKEVCDSANDPHGVAKEVKRKASGTANDPLDIDKLWKVIKWGKESEGSVHGAAKEGKKKKGGEFIDVDDYIYKDYKK